MPAEGGGGMPLYEGKTLPPVDPPRDLDPDRPVFRIRFTEEVFRDYQEYLRRLELYRRRRWTCGVTGRLNLTYEEALFSEKQETAGMMARLFPEPLIKPTLQAIQYSMLSLKDLVDKISTKLQESWLEGIETYARKENYMCPCKITRMIDDGAGIMRYEVAWLGNDKEVVGSAVVTRKDIISKKFPFSRNMLKSFIRESTWRNAPWVIHDRLAEKHEISRDLPKELKSKFVFYNGKLVSFNQKRTLCKEENETLDNKVPDGNHKRRKVDDSGNEVQGNHKRGKVDDSGNEVQGERSDETKSHPMKYPIEDLLVRSCPDDPAFTNRPVPSRDFKVPIDCVADLLMVWDFCSSFRRLLNLYPFSLEDFENSICHKDGNLALLVESHSAFLQLLIKDRGEYFSALRRKKRNFKITLLSWAEYLSDFLDMMNQQDLCSYVGTVKKGHYALLSVDAKLDIFRKLVDVSLQTDIFREQLDDFIDQLHELGATRRGEALEEARKRREAKQGLKSNFDESSFIDGQNITGEDEGLDGAPDNNCHKTNGVLALEKNSPFLKKRNCEVHSATMDKMQIVEDDDAKKHENVPGGTSKHAENNKSSKELRKRHYEREVEKLFIRANPLGKDKDHNRYWWFRRDGRIFVESSDSKTWGYYDSRKELDALMGSLNTKGERERALLKQLEKFYSRICLGLQKRSKDMAEKVALEETVLRRSTRVRATPRESTGNAYLRYINKWKED
ncbi:hypothetical protein MLD38_020453 [Melastoma candidum]|uniref:Uncharacterized protein n=1 Tax=Melastoma candidum TaxID=119954 RepID=A0ACB9QEU0_9MYRT|nr:hypothetical protein MLD38_020453 [Melastoma candidum]